jgi:hypothetical protein
MCNSYEEFKFRPLCCLSFNLRLLTTSLVSSNFSYLPYSLSRNSGTRIARNVRQRSAINVVAFQSESTSKIATRSLIWLHKLQRHINNTKQIKKDELLSKITDGKNVSKESSHYIFAFFIYFRQWNHILFIWYSMTM